ncbi:hypothetical protein [Arthrobacter sp. Soil763]|uniref:hypothetical protein n=1 Tax=Arthrobacter sp. Soil763 TaxID=1736402 RepID=UPI0006F761BC|nr:hypothetical protein [Arthrobacter sp. Soil763]KRE79966.1 hypothetical protein ASG71_07990 [Arthrobacter sp. Soil763]
MSGRDEPSYLAFARADARNGHSTSPGAVRELVARIDRDAVALKAAQPRIVRTLDELEALRLPAIIDSPSGGPMKIEYYGGPGRRKYIEPVFGAGDESDECYSPTFFAEFGLPATVLHEATK